MSNFPIELRKGMPDGARIEELNRDNARLMLQLSKISQEMDDLRRALEDKTEALDALKNLHIETLNAGAAKEAEGKDIEDQLIARCAAAEAERDMYKKQCEEKADTSELNALNDILHAIQEDLKKDNNESSVPPEKLIEISAKIDSILEAQQMAALPKEPDDVEVIITDRDLNGYAKRMVARRINK